MNRELYDEAIRSNILSRKLIEQLMESMNSVSSSSSSSSTESKSIYNTNEFLSPMIGIF